MELDRAGNILAGPFSEDGALGPCEALVGASTGPRVALVCTDVDAGNHFAVAPADDAIQASTSMDGCERALGTPQVVWTGSEHLVLYGCSEDGARSMRVVSLDASGIEASAEQTLAFMESDGAFAAAWNGSAVDFLWFAYDASPVEQVAYRFATMTRDGSLLREPVTTFSVSVEALGAADIPRAGPLLLTQVSDGYLALSAFVLRPIPPNRRLPARRVEELVARAPAVRHPHGTMTRRLEPRVSSNQVPVVWRGHGSVFTQRNPT